MRNPTTIRYDLNNPDDRHVTSVGYDEESDTFFGYSFTRRYGTPITVNVTRSGARPSAPTDVIAAVRPLATAMPLGLLDILPAHRRPGAAPAHAPALRTVAVETDGQLHETATATTADPRTPRRPNRIHRASLTVVRVGPDLLAFINDGAPDAAPNLIASAMLCELGAPGRLFHGPVVFTGAQGPARTSLPPVHAHRLHDVHAHVRAVIRRARLRHVVSYFH